MIPCSAKGCKSNRSIPGVILFRFPKDYLERGWMKMVNKPLNWRPKPNTRICCLHFPPGSFLGKKLKPGANPVPDFPGINPLLSGSPGDIPLQSGAPGDNHMQSRPSGTIPLQFEPTGDNPLQSRSYGIYPLQSGSSVIYPLQSGLSRAISLLAKPSGAIPLQSEPSGAIPLQSGPSGAIPLQSEPSGDNPLLARPFGAIPLQSGPSGDFSLLTEEIIFKEKFVSIKKKIPPPCTEQGFCTVYVQEDDVKVEFKETSGKNLH